MKAENKARASLVYKTAGMPTKDTMTIDNAMHYPCHVTEIRTYRGKLLHNF
ncbi:hypothetical protein APHMUC_1224 [Anaplasma phagocytophilum str. ApMUC09]|uniref:Uncharacterized protein n=1 Tax=Anaplasma phagocytophilum str. ApMUC09 TaxID=1359152 RepID=A0A0F3NBP3_ANAPH|nr:hypothetical protein APHMUC_1224 [Anaplasma phagocytophilum str. ApMUC09]